MYKMLELFVRFVSSLEFGEKKFDGLVNKLKVSLLSSQCSI